MKKIVTFTPLQHPDIEILYHPHSVLQEDVDMLIGVLRKMVAEGVTFAPGASLQVGWSLLLFEAKGGGLAVKELDLSGIPGQMQPGVTGTIRSLRLQREALASVGLASRMQFPSARQAALACTRFYESNNVYIFRSEPSGDDSGWFFGCSDPAHDHENPQNLVGGTLYELACRREKIIKYLAFPANFAVLFEDGRVKTIFNDDGEALVIEPDSPLDLLIGEQI